MNIQILYKEAEEPSLVPISAHSLPGAVVWYMCSCASSLTKCTILTPLVPAVSAVMSVVSLVSVGKRRCREQEFGRGVGAHTVSCTPPCTWGERQDCDTYPQNVDEPTTLHTLDRALYQLRMYIHVNTFCPPFPIHSQINVRVIITHVRIHTVSNNLIEDQHTLQCGQCEVWREGAMLGMWLNKQTLQLTAFQLAHGSMNNISVQYTCSIIINYLAL